MQATWRRETFKFSTDPELEAKVRDVVGLYLNPPDKAVVLSIDEKSQIQAVDRTAPILPMRPGPPEKRPTTICATALPQACRQDLPAGEAAHRLRQLRHPQAPERAGLAREEPADHHALRPTSGSWLNMVEIFSPGRRPPTRS
jgi:hypothetical protein